MGWFSGYQAMKSLPEREGLFVSSEVIAGLSAIYLGLVFGVEAGVITWVGENLIALGILGLRTLRRAR